jgi:hypothetical protein
MEMVQIIGWLLEKLGISGILPDFPTIEVTMPWEGLTEKHEFFLILYYMLIGVAWTPLIVLPLVSLMY